MNKIEKLINELCPDGVEWKSIDNIATIYNGLTGKGKSDFEEGTAKYVTYKNIFSNIEVNKSALEFVKISENEKQNSICYGDVLFTSSSESSLEVGLSSAVTFEPKSEVYLNSFSFGVRFNENIEMIPEFSKYLFRSNKLRKEIIKTASGVTRYNVSKKAFKKIKIPVPPLEIQEEIVKILDKFTDYVTELTTELTLRQKQYNYYRDKLLTFENQFYKVEWKTLESISTSISTGVTPKKSNNDYYVGGTIPWLRTNEVRNNEITKTDMSVTEKALKETSIKWVSENSVIVAISGATAGRLAINKIPLTTNQHCCCITIDSSIANYKYVFYWLLNKNDDILDLKQGARGDLNMGMIKKFNIPIPSLEIQSRIVQVLDNFDAVCNDLNIGLPKEIELRQKQYEFFRDKLLTFAAEGVYTDSTVQYSTVQYRQDIIRLLQWVFGPIKVKLGSISHCISGATPKTSEPHYWFDGTIPWMSSGEVNKGFVYETEKYISQEGYDSCSTKLVPKDTVVIALAGQGKTRGTVAVTKIELCTNQSLCSIITDSSINSHFLYYYLKGQYTNLRELSSGDGTRGGLNLSMIKGLIIPLPPVAMQNSMVKILDNFEKIINDLETGLPKEIELRQKQYEYYRDKLLSFD